MDNKDREKKLLEDFEEGKTAYTANEKLVCDKALLQLKADLMEKFQTTAFKEDDERREIWRKMQTIDWFHRTLEEIVNNGKIAQEELKGFAKLKQKLMG